MASRPSDVPSAERSAYAAPALEKGLDILELLAADPEPLSMRAVADRLGRSKSEIFRMVHVLIGRGWLAREPDTDRLVLTDRLFQLGMRAPRPRQLVDVALPAMERLATETAQSSHLVVLSRGETVVVASASGGTDLSLSLRLGYRRPAAQAVSGLLILAFQPPERQRRLLAECGAADDPAVAAILDGIRARGDHVADSRDVVGVTDIGCPILGADGAAVASIVVPYLNRHGAPGRHGDVRARLRETCAAIAAALG